MQHQTIALVGVGLLFTALGCATGEGASSVGEGLGSADLPVLEKGPVAEGPKPKEEPYRPGEMKVGLGDEPDSAVGVQLERGFLNQNDVNAVLEKHATSLTDCYERAGEARRYASGKVKLRFL